MGVSNALQEERSTMMKAKQLLMAAGAAMALATFVTPAHASGGVRVQFFGPIHVQPYTPVYVTHPVYVNPWYVQPVIVNPYPVVVTPPPIVVNPPVVVPAMADLAVAGYKLYWTHDATGALKRMLTFQIANLGTLSATASTASVSLGGDPVYVSVPTLLPGQSTTLAIETSGIVTPGTMVNIIADVRGEVPDANLRNNQLLDRWMP
jgi:hypothetical protein